MADLHEELKKLADRLDKVLGCHADSMPKEAYFEIDSVRRALAARPATVPEGWLYEFSDPDPQYEFEKGERCPRGWVGKARPLFGERTGVPFSADTIVAMERAAASVGWQVLPHVIEAMLAAAPQPEAQAGADDDTDHRFVGHLYASPKPAEGGAVYLVPTGIVHEGMETYTRHDACPPMCDADRLFPRPIPATLTEDGHDPT